MTRSRPDRIARNLVRLRRAAEVVAALADAGIEVLILKGMALIEATGDLGLREMFDLDLLVRPADADRGGAVLRALGYERYVHTGRGWSARLHYARAYLKAGDLAVDLHTRLAPHFLWRVDHEELWRGAAPLALGDVDTQRLGTEAMLVHTALNAAKDAFPEPERIASDLAAIAGSLAPDWGEVVALARRWRATTAVYRALELARKPGAAAVPGSAVDRLRPSRWRTEALERAGNSEGFGRLPLVARRAIIGSALTDAPLRYAGWVGRAAAVRALDRFAPAPVLE